MTPEFRTTIIGLMRDNSVKELNVTLGNDDSISFYTELEGGYSEDLATISPDIFAALKQEVPSGMVITRMGVNDCKFPS